MSHSSSTPNLVDTGSAYDFPPVSALQTQNVPPANGPSTKIVEEVYAANTSLWFHYDVATTVYQLQATISCSYAMEANDI
ncbi:hypothetical protein Tco_1027529 [Tanacetum coccineum]